METRNDPYGQFNFQVKIDGIIVAAFSEVSGLTSDTSIIEYREGSDNVGTVRKLPGLRKYNHIVLKRGWTSDNKLWTWRKSVIDGQTQRKTGSNVLLDESRSPVLSWEFCEGWPSKWEGPAVNAQTSEVAIETLEITCEDVVERL
jgi:phage tail-like protein